MKLISFGYEGPVFPRLISSQYFIAFKMSNIPGVSNSGNSIRSHKTLDKPKIHFNDSNYKEK